MKVPREAIDELLSAEAAARARIAEEEARRAAAARARENAATELVAGVEGIRTAAHAQARPRAIPSNVEEIIDRVFSYLARPQRVPRWEELARAGLDAGMTDLSRALDDLAVAAGTRDETPCRVEVAIEAALARSRLRIESSGATGPDAPEHEAPVARGWTAARDALRWSARVESVANVVEIALGPDGWIAADDSGAPMRVEPGATLAAIMSDAPGGAVVEAMVAKSEALGVFCVPVRCRPASATGWIRLA